ncbi:hypothetical protein BDA99DRAFT_446949, partial [Phascolomyces articulosus]
IFDAICYVIDDPQNKRKLFFINGPRGIGKTYLFNALLDYVRCQDYIVLTIALSGTASLLLNGGCTAL